VYDDFDFVIRRTERWCVMGRNGAGKTTLLKLVAGLSEPDAGMIRLGAGLRIGYFAQQALDLLDPALSVFEQLQQDFPAEGQGTLRNLLGAFQFPGDDIEKPIRVLSGGEKSRLVLARMLFDPPNFLILDEPTNHLDLESKEMLVAALKDFEGTMLFVSHDRTCWNCGPAVRAGSRRSPRSPTSARTLNSSSAPAPKRRACTTDGGGRGAPGPSHAAPSADGLDGLDAK
jgi:ATPase subunit of ABC transporter with duplicated ATPase domains